MKKAYLVLENGTVFEGQSVGAEGNTLGEMAFNTGVVGYMEAITDAAMQGKILLQTFPLIGNYGVITEDIKAPAAVAGYVVRELCATPSNFRCEYPLDDYLKANGIIGIAGVDTRAVMSILRDAPGIKGAICTELPEDISAIFNK